MARLLGFAADGAPVVADDGARPPLSPGAPLAALVAVGLLVAALTLSPSRGMRANGTGRGMRRNGETYAAAKVRLLRELAELGWDTAPRLKFPHASKGGVRVFFKAQSVYVGPTLNDARSLWIDTRGMSVASFVKHVSGEQHSFRSNASRSLAPVDPYDIEKGDAVRVRGQKGASGRRPLLPGIVRDVWTRGTGVHFFEIELSDPAAMGGRIHAQVVSEENVFPPARRKRS